MRKFLCLRRRGGVVNTTVAIATANAFIARNPACLSSPSPGWAKSLFTRMGFTKRGATTSKLMIPKGAQKEAELLYLHEIVSIAERHAISSSMIPNLDQTPCKFVQSSRYTMAKKGSTNVEIVGSGDKRSITATFVVSLSGSFLPMQLIYDGKTERSIPRVDFPSSFSLSANPKHFSNTEESIKVINEVIVPYVTSKRKELKLPSNSPALLFLDVFRGQMTQQVTSLLAEKNIIFVKVPNNMTHIIQPLDLSVNGWAKQSMRKKFAAWYAEKIREELDKGLELESIEVKMPLTVMKPLHAKWLIEMYNVMTSEQGKDVIVSGWEASGICEAIKIGC